MAVKKTFNTEVSNKLDYLTTTGTITGIGLDTSKMGFTTVEPVSWALKLEYEDEANGKSYSSNKYAVSGNPKGVEQVYLYNRIGNIAKGENVPVYYLKHDPSFAVLSLKIM